jgi:RimJ/RimL family protein N-acetyltransferase
LNIPLLESARLQLRAARLEDFPAHAAMWADPRTRVYFQNYPYSEEDCWMRFQRNLGQWHLFGYGFWAIIDKASNRYAGSIGFFQAKRAIDVPFGDQPEAGWAVAPDFHRRGYAREALAAALTWADVHIEADSSWCLINPDNLPSRKVAEGAGYREAQKADYKGVPVMTFLRPRGQSS